MNGPLTSLYAHHRTSLYYTVSVWYCCHNGIASTSPYCVTPSLSKRQCTLCTLCACYL